MVCGDKFKHHNYYETLLAIAPELQKCDPGKLESKKVPSLKTVIQISEDSPVYSSGTYNFHEILNLASSTEIANIQKMQLSISPDDGCSLHFTSVRFLFYLELQVLMSRHFSVPQDNPKRL